MEEISKTVRKIDDLGRIVIPKSIRKALGIEKTYMGKPYEISYNDKGEIILKPVEERCDDHNE